MPFSFNFVERFPIPSLRNYVGFSVALLMGIVYYSYDTVANDDLWQIEFKQKIVDNGLSNSTRTRLISSVVARVFYFMLTDQVCIWTVINTACCSLVLIGKMLQNVVFGRLRIIEHQQMRDRFWNFIFYKFVFVFGVMNVQYFDEVFMWSLWFASSGFLYLLTTLAQDRLKYTSSLPASSRMVNARILFFLLIMLFCGVGMFGVSVFGILKLGINYGSFMMAESAMLLLRITHGLLRYGMCSYDVDRQTNWEDRNTFEYYVDLILEMCLLCTDFVHHVHMLLWGNIFLSMASLVICMQLKYLYQEIDKRLRSHRNYQRIVHYIDTKYPLASVTALSKHDDKCAICWDKMETARQLTCGHLFHSWCLHSWLKQDTSCPTCRVTLSITPSLPVATRHNSDVPAQQNFDDEPTNRRRGHRTNHLFRFDGRRYARWLPSFSVEVSHSIGRSTLVGRAGPRLSDITQITRLVEQVREMFPHLAADVVEQDLRRTNRVEETIENILNGQIYSAEDEVASDGAAVSDTDAESEYESDLASTSDNESPAFADDPGAATVDEQAPSTSSASSSTMMLVDSLLGVMPASSDEEQPSTSGSADDLDGRKRRLFAQHRRRYVASSRGADLRALLDQCAASAVSGRSKASSSLDKQLSWQDAKSKRQRDADEHARRRMLFHAAQRHLPVAGVAETSGTPR